MNVVVLTTSYPQSIDDPSGHFVEAEARALAADGDRVTVLCPGPARPHQTHEPSLEVVSLGCGSLFSWPGALARLRSRPYRAVQAVRFVLALRRTLRRLAPVDKVIAHWLVPCGYPAALRSSGQLEVVAHGSDVRLLCKLPRPLRLHILRALGERHATLRFVSHELANRLRSDLDAAPRLKFRVAPSPIHLDTKLNHQASRLELGIAAAERLVVVVGRLVKTKRVDTALRALSLVPGARVVVIGDGPERKLLSRGFPQASFTGNIPRSEALKWLSAADLLVSASRLEGSPTVVREARALRTPVVACASGDLREWAVFDSGLWVID